MIQDNMAALERLCREFRVRRLEAFGSVVTGSYDPDSSDIDLLVEYLPLEPGQRSRCYFGLLAALEKLFGRPIDLVMARAIRNRFFLEAVNKSRTVLYAA